MNLKIAHLWKAPLNLVKRPTDLEDIIQAIEEVNKICDNADQIPGHKTEKGYLKHMLWYNQLVWLDLANSLTRYVKKKMGPEATVKDMIDQWDHPFNVWLEHFVAFFFEDALGLKTDNGKEVWEFGDYILDLIDISKMLVADMKVYWLAAHFAQIGPFIRR